LKASSGNTLDDYTERLNINTSPAYLPLKKEKLFDPYFDE
jgi:hypothetical protein